MTKKEWMQEIKFHKPDEIKELIYSAIILGIAFNIAIFGRENPFEFVLQWQFLFYFVPTFVVVLISLAGKEISQKVFARQTECFVRYEMWTPGAVVALLSSFLGFVVAAVGGVKASADYRKRYGRWVVNVTAQQLGLISMIGVGAYLFIGIFFLLLEPLIPIVLMGRNLMTVAFEINILLAIFSLIPLKPLDGEKLIVWNTYLWFVMVLMSVSLVLLF